MSDFKRTAAFNKRFSKKRGRKSVCDIVFFSFTIIIIMVQCFSSLIFFHGSFFLLQVLVSNVFDSFLFFLFKLAVMH